MFSAYLEKTFHPDLHNTAIVFCDTDESKIVALILTKPRL